MDLSSEMRSCAWSYFIPSHPNTPCPELSVHLVAGGVEVEIFHVTTWSSLAALPARFFQVCPAAGVHVPWVRERKFANIASAYWRLRLLGKLYPTRICSELLAGMKK
jgi:hypothetical protein